MTPPKLIIFDCDGVLVDSEPLSIKFLIGDLARYGLSLTVADCETQFVGGTAEGDAVTATRLGAKLPTDWAETFDSRVVQYLKLVCPWLTAHCMSLMQLNPPGSPTALFPTAASNKCKLPLARTGCGTNFRGEFFRPTHMEPPNPTRNYY